MKNCLLVTISLYGLLLSSHAHADCQYNGQWVPTGTRAGGYTCQANGEWK